MGPPALSRYTMPMGEGSKRSAREGVSSRPQRGAGHRRPQPPAACLPTPHMAPRRAAGAAVAAAGAPPVPQPYTAPAPAPAGAPPAPGPEHGASARPWGRARFTARGGRRSLGTRSERTDVVGAVLGLEELISPVEGMYLALIEPGSYLDFANPVPFTDADGVIEQGVLNAQGRISGRAQLAVRPLSASDFNRIVSLGLDQSEPMLPRVDEAESPPGLQEEQATLAFEHDRDRLSYVTSPIVWDRVLPPKFVLRAYDARCAITGLKLINGGGRAESPLRISDRSKRTGRISSAMGSPSPPQRTGCSIVG